MVNLRLSTQGMLGGTAWRVALFLMVVAVGVAPPAIGAENGGTMTLRTIKGEAVRVVKEGDRVQLPGIQARAILINFWATWCDPCREEIPDLIHLYEKYREKGFLVVGISLDTSMEKLANFVKEYRIPYPIWVGDKTLVRSWMVRGLPASYLVDGEGKIRREYLGARKGATFEKHLLKLLPVGGQAKGEAR